MHEIYNEEYYKQYDVGDVKVNYMESDDLKNFLNSVADNIVNDLHPKTVLDAGCATGHLVAALRDRGVEAYGIDISEYAISVVREDVRQYCAVGSLADPLPDSLPDRFDLVISIEVLEHLTAEDGVKAIHNLCSHTDRFIFSSTPDDITDPTHINVQEREYWARVFAQAGFADDVTYRPRYLTNYASCFKRCRDWWEQLDEYERNIRLTDNELKEKDCQIQERIVLIQERDRKILEQIDVIQSRDQQLQNQSVILTELTHHVQKFDGILEDKDRILAQAVAERDAANVEIQQLTRENADKISRLNNDISELVDQNAELKEQVEFYMEHRMAALNMCNELRTQLDSANQQLAVANANYNAISNATFWKITKPLRVFTTWVKKLLKSNRVTLLIGKGIKSLMQHGFSYTWKRVKLWRNRKRDYLALINKPLFTQEELEAQRNHEFPKDITFSVLVPLYNTPSQFLHEMIQSVLNQTYGKWELCLADGSDDKHPDVGTICKRYAQKDSRVVYKKLEKNLGISGNTNACIEMATGNFISLFDHDDLLHPSALHETMRVICEEDADYVYTDEAVFESPDVTKVVTIHLKPDFAIDNLRGNNYICHFSSFSREILEKAGMFRSAYDGSQDHDMILRLTANAKKVVHIPEILYYWRSHPQSVAKDISSKEYAITAGRNAVCTSVKDCGYPATVESSWAFPTVYRIKYELKDTPKVSIIIPTRNHLSGLKRCMESILKLTTYPDYEIVIADNHSDDSELLKYYEELKCSDNVVICSVDEILSHGKLMNYASKQASGAYYLMLDDSAEVITPEWIEELLMYVQRDDVAAAGAMLYYSDDTIRHAGMILGMGSDRVAGYPFHKCPKRTVGYMGRLGYSQNMSAVSAACMMVKASVFQKIGGFDETFGVAFNDVDLCMRMRREGYLIVWTPFAELYHHENDLQDHKLISGKPYASDVKYFHSLWSAELAAGDPYYNPHFSLDREDFYIQ